MIGVLTNDEIDALLVNQRSGRLAMCDGGRPYLVSMDYCYDGQSLYFFSAAGCKIELMRRNPFVSFLVEEVQNRTSWRSVLIEGRFLELTDVRERQQASAYVDGCVQSEVNRELFQSSDIVLFRVSMERRWGRFERRDN